MSSLKAPPQTVHGGVMLRRARIYQGVSIRQMASRLHTDKAAIWRHEGCINPRWWTIVAYGSALGLDLPRLVSFATPSPPSPPSPSSKSPRSTSPRRT